MRSGARALALGTATCLLVAACGDQGPSVDINPASGTPTASTSAASGPTSSEPLAAEPSESEPSPSAPAHGPPTKAETIGLDASVEARRSWSLPLPEGFELETFDAEGQNRMSAPSKCLLDTYQGAFFEAGFEGSDAEGTETVYERLLEDYEDLSNVEIDPLDPLVVPAAEATNPDIEFAGFEVAYTAEGKDGFDIIYYRGMPSADANMIMWWICPEASISQGEVEFEKVLDGLTVAVRPSDV